VASDFGTDLLPSPVNLVGEQSSSSRPAPFAGEYTAEVLGEVLGLTEEAIADLRAAGILGEQPTP
jgi:crotonobetainyl-CoA:carnitine CoA-transferase CaiB-like acyl-CoA transferase